MKSNLTSLVALIVAAVMGCGTAAAFTADQLTDCGYGVCLLQSDMCAGGVYTSGGTLTITPVDGVPGRIAVSGLFEEAMVKPVFHFDIDGETVTIANNGLSTDKRYQLVPIGYNSSYRPSRLTQSVAGYYGLMDDVLTGTISSYDMGGSVAYDLDFGPVMLVAADNLKYDVSASDFQAAGNKLFIYSLHPSLSAFSYRFHSLEITVYTPNAWVSDGVYDPSTGNLMERRNYPVRIWETPENGITWIFNFSDNGYAVDYSQDNIVTYVGFYDNHDGSATMPMGQAGLNASYTDENKYYQDQVGYFWKWIPTNYYSISDAESINLNIKQYDIEHIDGHNHWVNHVNGGILATKTGFEITFDEAYVLSGLVDPTDRYWYLSKYWSDEAVVGEILIDGAKDITTRVDIIPNQYDYRPEIGLWVNGTIAPKPTDEVRDHITGYELFIAPGAINTVSGLATNSDSGLSSGRNLSEHMASSRAAFDPYAFIDYGVFIPVDELGDLNIGNSTGHTLYVKTSYDNMAPSYHALTPLTTIVTGIEDAAMAAVRISVIDGAITVEGHDGNMEVYTPDGSCIYSGPAEAVRPGAGMYIVRAGAAVSKIVIR